MKRRLFAILSSLSLVLCIASGGMWVRSSRHVDLAHLHMPYHVATIFSLSGSVCFEWMLATFEQQEWRTERGLDNASPQPGLQVRTLTETYSDGMAGEYMVQDRGRCLMGFWLAQGHNPYWNSESPPFLDGWQVGIPYWAIILLTAILPLRAAFRWCRKRHRNNDGLCPTCGYDLRASPDRCPECGRPIPAGLIRRPGL